MVFIYTTCKDVEQAKDLGKRIMKARIATCVNIWPINSMYWWEGALREGSEAVLIVKTNESKMAEIEAFLSKNHDYSVPVVAAFTIDRINREYREWSVSQIVK